jgi:hypothetical protein
MYVDIPVVYDKKTDKLSIYGHGFYNDKHGPRDGAFRLECLLSDPTISIATLQVEVKDDNADIRLIEYQNPEPQKKKKKKWNYQHWPR